MTSGLLAPLAYLRIRHALAWRYNVILPLAGAVALPWLLRGLPNPVPAFGNEGFLAQLQSVIAILGGFFVAALTFINSGSNPRFDEYIAGRNPPTLACESGPLTRRRFLAYLFGYLSFLAFSLLVTFAVGNALAAGLHGQLPPTIARCLAILFLAVVGAALCHLLTTALIGLFYLTERLHRPTLYARPNNARQSTTDHRHSPHAPRDETL